MSSEAAPCFILISLISMIQEGAAQFPGPMANPGGDPFHQGGATLGFGGTVTQQSAPYSASFSVPCVPGTTCDLSCDIGYLNGPMNSCQYCICATAQFAAYMMPCVDQPMTCDLPCAGGFETDPVSGCQNCKCVGGSTIAPSTTADTPIVSSTTSAEECIMKITRCQIRFPFGFLTDNGCDLCVSKDDIYDFSGVPLERQPVIKLSNPCIQGFDRCMIFCKTGYRTGPRNCQYCACNN